MKQRETPPLSASDPICITCGIQYETSAGSPERSSGRYRNVVAEVEPGMTGVVTEPGFVIGQRACLIRTEAGNLLWDCVSYLDDETAAAIERVGGIDAIAISHPHFYSAMGEWSRAFGDAPIHLQADNAPWVMRSDPAIRFWSGETFAPIPGLTVIRCGGHFPGSSVLHWPVGDVHVLVSEQHSPRGGRRPRDR